MHCRYCEWRCNLSNEPGICKRYCAQGGKVVEVQPYEWLPYHPYHIEGMPFYHAIPETIVLQLGTVCCNAGCDSCVNSHLSKYVNETQTLRRYNPQQLLRLARQEGAKGFVFALNEVTVYLPSALAVARAARKAGMKVGCLTNGFQTQEVAEILAREMDFINVSVKSLDDDFIQTHLHLPGAGPLLRNLRIFHRNTHLEVMTPLVREVMGRDIHQILNTLVRIDPETPWHLFRLMHTYNRPPKKELMPDEMFKLLQWARKRLPFTYLVNFAGSPFADTDCPECNKKLIRRLVVGGWNTQVLENNLQGNCCPDCGRHIPFVL